MYAIFSLLVLKVLETYFLCFFVWAQYEFKQFQLWLSLVPLHIMSQFMFHLLTSTLYHHSNISTAPCIVFPQGCCVESKKIASGGVILSTSCFIWCPQKLLVFVSCALNPFTRRPKGSLCPLLFLRETLEIQILQNVRLILSPSDMDADLASPLLTQALLITAECF